MGRRLVSASTALIVAFGLVMAVGGTAQEATPEIGRLDELVAPDPAECLVGLRPRPQQSEPISPPAGTAVATPDFEAIVREGHSADAETAAAVTVTVREIFACLNAGDRERAFALFDDAALPRLFVVAPLFGVKVEAISGTPVALADDDWTAVRIRDVRILADDRVTAFIDGRTPAGQFVLFAIFERRDDRYVISAFVAMGSQLATPSP